MGFKWVLVGVGVSVAAVVLTAGALALPRSGTITTYAGNGKSADRTRYSPHHEGIGDGGPATKAHLDAWGLAMDGQGNLYIAGSSRVRKVNPSGTITTIAGNGACCGHFLGDGIGGPATKVHMDVGWVAADGKGNVYLTDSRSQEVLKVDRRGTLTAFAGSHVFGFSGDGRPATSAWLRDPKGLAVDAQGNVYIADTGNYRVRKVRPNGTITTVAGSGVPYPSESGIGGSATRAKIHVEDVAVDARGNLYIASGISGFVRKVTPGGTITNFAGTGNAHHCDGGARLLCSPDAVAVDTKGNLYVTDTNHYIVHKISPSGKVTGLAGIGRLCGRAIGVREDGNCGDGGLATRAKLDPSDVTVDRNGNVYVSDPRDLRVRKVRAKP
jgi:serine/threonine-protein kinase